VDFSKAVDVGMALTVHLHESEPSIDQLFVLGVSGETDVAVTAARVSAALASHARLGALEFIPPRAPTNNTTDSPSAWHSEMPQAVAPDAQRIGFDPAGPRNAASVARALGVDGSNVLAGIPGAADDWQTSSGIMIDALFPGLTVDWDMLRRRDMNFEHEAIFPMAPFDENAPLAAARRRKGQRARPLCDVVLRGATVGCRRFFGARKCPTRTPTTGRSP